MPQIPGNEKAAFIALVQAAPGGYIEAFRLQTILYTYDDIRIAILRQRNVFAGNNAYLTQVMDVFTDANELLNAGIWYKKNLTSPPVTNPVLIINSNIDDDVFLEVTSPPTAFNLTVLGPSYIKRLYLGPAVNLFQLYMGDGVTIDQVDSSATGALINLITMVNIANNPPRLNYAKGGSKINAISPDSQYFGGFSVNDPTGTCNSPIADYKYDIITHNTISLTWTPPSMQSPPLQYLFINTYYREKGSDTWLLAGPSAGWRNGETGFTFNSLKTDTTYEFRSDVVCNNGGISSTAVLTAATTAVA